MRSSRRMNPMPGSHVGARARAGKYCNRDDEDVVRDANRWSIVRSAAAMYLSPLSAVSNPYVARTMVELSALRYRTAQMSVAQPQVRGGQDASH